VENSTSTILHPLSYPRSVARGSSPNSRKRGAGRSINGVLQRETRAVGASPDTRYRASDGIGVTGRRRVALCRSILPSLVLLFLLLAPACSPPGVAASGGPSPPPSGSLSVSFIDVGQGDGILVQAGGTSHLVDAGRPEEGANVVDFLRARGVEGLDGIVVTNPPSS
jgi:hypothetical protein